MENLHPDLAMLGEIALAMLLGGLVGLDRSAADKPAGARTQMLVAGAAAMLIGLGDALLDHFEGIDGVAPDPFRLLGAIVTGVSFLGAGTIIRRTDSKDVEGLTTAASILLSAAIGVAVALDRMALAAGVTVLTLGVLRGLGALERRVRPSHNED